MKEYIVQYTQDGYDNNNKHEVYSHTIMGELVRCEHCEYRQDDITHNFCEIHNHKCYDDDFCSWSELKRKKLK